MTAAASAASVLSAGSAATAGMTAGTAVTAAPMEIGKEAADNVTA